MGLDQKGYGQACGNKGGKPFMITRLFGRYLSCCLDMDAGKWSCAPFTIKGGKRCFKKVVSASEPRCPDSVCKIFSAIHSRNANLLVTNFPKMKPDLLKIQVEERLRQESIIGDDLPLNIAFKSIGGGANMKRLIAAGVPAQDVEPILQMEAAAKGALRVLLPSFFAISALFGALTEQAVLVVVCHKEYIELLVVKDGLAWIHQIMPVSGPWGLPEMLEAKDLTQGIQQVGQRCKRNFNFTPTRLVCLGLKPSQVPKRIGGQEVWRPEFKDLLVLEDQDDFYLYPAVLGAAFSKGEFNLVPDSWSLSFRVQQAASIMACTLAAGSLLLAGGALGLHYKNSQMEAQYLRAAEVLRQKARRLESMLPPDGVKSEIERISWLKARAASDPKPHELLLAVGALLPSKFKIESLSVQRAEGGQEDAGLAGDGHGHGSAASGPVFQVAHRPESDPGDPDGPAAQAVNQGGISTSAAERLLTMPLKVSLVLVTRGDFSASKALFQHTVTRLSRHFSIEDSRWQFKEAESLARMEVAMIVPDTTQAGREAHGTPR
jgi:hypothetical protein